MAIKFDHTGAGDVTLDSTQAVELRVDGVPLLTEATGSGLFPADTSGVADHDMLFFDVDTWKDTAGLITWDEVDLSLNTGSGLFIYDSTDSDAAHFYHDGTDFFADFPSGTDWWRITNVGSGVLFAGGALRIYDDGVTDFAGFEHTGTDFITTLSNTTDWDIVGLTGNFWLRDGAILKISNSTDVDHALHYCDGTDYITDLQGLDWWKVSTQGSGLLLDNGMDFRIYDSSSADYASFSHDGQDFNTVFGGTTDWNIGSGMNGAGVWKFDKQSAQSNRLYIGSDITLYGDGSNSFLHLYAEDSGSIFSVQHEVTGNTRHVIRCNPADTLPMEFENFTNVVVKNSASGGEFRVYEPSPQSEYIGIRHDGSDVLITGQNMSSAEARITQFQYWNISGTSLRVSNSGNTDWVDFDHDGADFNVDCTNTDKFVIAGFTGRFQVNEEAASQTNVYLGEDSTLRGDGANARLNIYGEQTSVIHRIGFFVDGSAHLMDCSPNNTLPLQITGFTRVELRNTAGGKLRVYDSVSDYFELSHDGTDSIINSTTSADLKFTNFTGFISMGTTAQMIAGAIGKPSWNSPHGSAPTVPTNGDFWTTTLGAFCRINGVSVNLTDTGGGGGDLGDLDNVTDAGGANDLLYKDSASTWDDTGGLLTWDLVTLRANRKTNATSRMLIGEESTLRGDAQIGEMRIYGEDTGALSYGLIQYDGLNLRISSSGSAPIRLIEDTEVRAGSLFSIHDGGNLDSATMSHDGTDFDIEFVGTTLYRIRDGVEVRIFDTADTNYISLQHDGTDGIITTPAGDLILAASGGGGQIIIDGAGTDSIKMQILAHDTVGSAAIGFMDSVLAEKGVVGFDNAGDDNFFLRNREESGEIRIQVTPAGEAISNAVVIDPDVDLSLWHSQGKGGATTISNEVLQTRSVATDGELSGCRVVDANDNMRPVGFNLALPVTQNNTIATTSDTWRTMAGHTMESDNGTAYTWTTPGSADAVVPDGYFVGIASTGTGVITIAAGSGVTLTWMDGAGLTGSRSLNQYGVGTLVKKSSTAWWIYGSGIT